MKLIDIFSYLGQAIMHAKKEEKGGCSLLLKKVSQKHFHYSIGIFRIKVFFFPYIPLLALAKYVNKVNLPTKKVELSNRENVVTLNKNWLYLEWLPSHVKRCLGFQKKRFYSMFCLPIIWKPYKIHISYIESSHMSKILP